MALTQVQGQMLTGGSLNVGNSTLGEGNASSFKNRIINGAMAIDQRNAGASYSVTGNAYFLDRWQILKSNGATITAIQSTDAPANFVNSLRQTVSVADTSIAAAEYGGMEQAIEGYNIADLGFGTVNAKTITLSFWIRSSVTGQYTGNFRNASASRIGTFNYTVNAANTWEQKIITFSGCQDGVWNTTNGVGLNITLYNVLGSDYTGGTDGTWNTTGKYGCGSPVNSLATTGNIIAITGVQLEKGSTATSFDYRPYGTELALCQRYYEKSYNTDTAVASNTAVGYYTICAGTNTANNALVPLRWKVEKRAAPTVSTYRVDGTANQWGYGRSGASGNAGTSIDNIGTSGARLYMDVGAAWTVAFIEGQWIASAEL